MKKKLLGLLLSISVLISTTAFAKSDHDKQSLVALGDSITYGYNLGKHNRTSSIYAFPYIIGREGDLRVRNLGVPGWLTEDLLSALKTNKKYRQAVKKADYVTLTIGSNDLLQALKAVQNKSAGDSSSFMGFLQAEIKDSNMLQNIGAIISIIRTLTNAPVVVYNIYNPFQVNNPLHVVGLNVLPTVNKGFTELTSMYNALFGNVHLADAYAAFETNQADYVLPNDIHPTIEGQIKLAEIGLNILNSNHQE